MLDTLARFIVGSGLRKFTAGLYILTASAYLCKLGVLSGELYTQIAVVVALALLCANVLEHYVKAMSAHPKMDAAAIEKARKETRTA